MTQYAFRAGRVRKIKADMTWDQYAEAHPDAFKTCKPPSEATLERWDMDGYCKALDGCRVEPDGECEHGRPSWLVALNYI